MGRLKFVIPLSLLLIFLPGRSAAENAQALQQNSKEGPFGQAMQVFRQPFEGERFTTNAFDHRFPRQFIDRSAGILTSFGEEVRVGINGHQGYDYMMPAGTPVYAAADGLVDFAGKEAPFFCPLLGRKVQGLQVVLLHALPAAILKSVYAHFEKLTVKSGQLVKRGDLLGLSGNTGCSTSPHLHFDVRRLFEDGREASIDPYGWNSSLLDPWAANFEGSASPLLWEPGFAPKYRRISVLPDDPGRGERVPAAVTAIQWAGWDDGKEPNNEYVELQILARNMEEMPLSGFIIENNAGLRYHFPADSALRPGIPLRLHSGKGTNGGTDLYWGSAAPIWANDGDCAKLRRPDGSILYYHYYGDGGCRLAKS